MLYMKYPTSSIIKKHCNMRTRSLTLMSYQFFLDWYKDMKRRFQGLSLKFVKRLTGSRVNVVIMY
jgi:hypothetical protein